MVFPITALTKQSSPKFSQTRGQRGSRDKSTVGEYVHGQLEARVSYAVMVAALRASSGLKEAPILMFCGNSVPPSV